MRHWIRATKNAEETRKMYLDHLDSVRMSGLGMPGYFDAIYASLHAELGTFTNTEQIVAALFADHGVSEE